jgi:hypothetical protein
VQAARVPTVSWNICQLAPDVFNSHSSPGWRSSPSAGEGRGTGMGIEVGKVDSDLAIGLGHGPPAQKMA